MIAGDVPEDRLFCVQSGAMYSQFRVTLSKFLKSKIRITRVEIYCWLSPYTSFSPVRLRLLAGSLSTFVQVNGPLVRSLFTNLHTSCPIRANHVRSIKIMAKQRQVVTTCPIFEIRRSKFTSLAV